MLDTKRLIAEVAARNGIRIDPELMERLKNAVWHLGKGLTISSVMEQAILIIIEDLEKDNNNGKPFPPRRGKLPKSPKPDR